MSIVVTGATGTIGKELVRNLSSEKADFKVLVTSEAKKYEALASVVANYRDVNTLIRAFEGADTLFLLTPDAPQVMQWVENAVNAAERAGVKHVVRSSGIGADAASPYAVMKQLGELERIVERSGIPWTFLRPNSFMQNFATFDRQAVRHGYLQVPRGDARISFVDVRDIAAVATSVLMNPEPHVHKAYTLTGPEALKMQEAVTLIGEQVGRTVTYHDIDKEAWATQMQGFGIPDWSINLLLSLYQADKDGVTAPVTNDIEEVTGQRARSFKAFVNDYEAVWSGG